MATSDVMSDDALRAAYADHHAGGGRDRDACVAPEALLAVAERTAPEPERLATLRHVGACARCRAELELLRTARDAARAVARPRLPLARILAAAAVVALLAGAAALWQALRPPEADPLRGAYTSNLRLLAPPPDVAVPPPVTLVWTEVAEALRYEVEVLRPDGTAAFEAVARDTSVVVPDAATLLPDVPYRWWVRAVLPDGSRLLSPPGRLRIAAP